MIGAAVPFGGYWIELRRSPPFDRNPAGPAPRNEELTIVVGYPTNRRAKAVPSLAGMLARSSGEEVVVCTVLPLPWVPGVADVDAQFCTCTKELAGVGSGVAGTSGTSPRRTTVARLRALSGPFGAPGCRRR